MTDHAPTPIRPRSEVVGTKDHLQDTEFLVYALVQAFKTLLAIASKRRPNIR